MCAFRPVRTGGGVVAHPPEKQAAESYLRPWAIVVGVEEDDPSQVSS